MSKECLKTVVIKRYLDAKNKTKQTDNKGLSKVKQNDNKSKTKIIK
jgi:hypothetical protein